MFESNNRLIPIITSNHTKLKYVYCLTVKHFNTIAFTIATIVQCKFQYISNKMQRYTVYYIWKLFYMFRVVPPPIIRSACNCIYSIWYLSHRYCYLLLSWKSWNWFECAVGGIRNNDLLKINN